MMFYLLQTNMVNIAIVLFLYVFLSTGATMNKQNQRIFMLATAVMGILIVADAVDYYLKAAPEPCALRYITSATGYTLRPAAIVLMVLIARRFERAHGFFLAVPFVVNAVIAFTSIFTHWMFYFDSTNEFQRGVLGILPFVVCGIYIVLLLVTSIKKYRIGNKMEAAVVVFIAVMLVMSSVMETVYHFKFIINGVGSTSIIFYYAFLNTQTYKRDALTNALNRHSFYSDSERLMKKSMVVVSLDLNDLKKINDTQGHEAGDDAISASSRIIYRHLPHSYQLYRMGGDEFAILCPKATMDIVEVIMEDIVGEAENCGYILAWGAEEYKPGMDFEQIFAMSDRKMYENKKQIKNGNQLENTPLL